MHAQGASPWAAAPPQSLWRQSPRREQKLHPNRDRAKHYQHIGPQHDRTGCACGLNGIETCSCLAHLVAELASANHVCARAHVLGASEMLSWAQVVAENQR